MVNDQCPVGLGGSEGGSPLDCGFRGRDCNANGLWEGNLRGHFVCERQCVSARMLLLACPDGSPVHLQLQTDLSLSLKRTISADNHTVLEIV